MTNNISHPCIIFIEKYFFILKPVTETSLGNQINQELIPPRSCREPEESVAYFKGNGEVFKEYHLYSYTQTKGYNGSVGSITGGILIVILHRNESSVVKPAKEIQLSLEPLCKILAID